MYSHETPSFGEVIEHKDAEKNWVVGQSIWFQWSTFGYDRFGKIDYQIYQNVSTKARCKPFFSPPPGSQFPSWYRTIRDVADSFHARWAVEGVSLTSAEIVTESVTVAVLVGHPQAEGHSYRSEFFSSLNAYIASKGQLYNVAHTAWTREVTVWFHLLWSFWSLHCFFHSTILLKRHVDIGLEEWRI